jgi:hypothetical protein
MKATIVTTITSQVDIDTFDTTHEVAVASADPLPESVAIAAAIGGCKSALKALQKDRPVRAINPKERP